MLLIVHTCFYQLNNHTPYSCMYGTFIFHDLSTPKLELNSFQDQRIECFD